MKTRRRKRLYDVLSSQQQADAVARTLRERYPGCRTHVAVRGSRVAVYADAYCFRQRQ
jgi:hypothetical protein